MRVHHLSCGTDCPVGGALFDGISRSLFGRLVCHCLLVETEHGLVLVDTGYGLKDVRQPHPRLSRSFTAMLNVQFRERETAIRQIESLGFRARDVRHIVLTHLDFDHAGGLEDFPAATVHVMDAELQAVSSRRGYVARCRYRPMQLDGIRHWQRYDAAGERWFGFPAVSPLAGLPPEILLIPLRGHTFGHAGVAVQSERGWLLHAGDAYFHRDEVGAATRRCTPGLRAYQWLMEVDRSARFDNQRRLRELSIDPARPVRIFCAHDAVEYDALANQ